MDPIEVGLLCILPPVIAIGLALITKEVLSSLMLGILSGTLIYALNTGAGPVSAVSNAFTIMADEFSASMIVFLCLLGGLVAVISMAGGARIRRMGRQGRAQPQKRAACHQCAGRSDFY